ncbi:hypothetical protein B0H11DRAFT_1901797 [Mycena galericulata]|nr:hypothetical protein B0H11DRAFT_1901797 [Mycena galericulata]
MRKNVDLRGVGGITDHSCSPSGESPSGWVVSEEVLRGLMLRLGSESRLVRFFAQVVSFGMKVWPCHFSGAPYRPRTYSHVARDLFAKKKGEERTNADAVQSPKVLLSRKFICSTQGRETCKLRLIQLENRRRTGITVKANLMNNGVMKENEVQRAMKYHFYGGKSDFERRRNHIVWQRFSILTKPKDHDALRLTCLGLKLTIPWELNCAYNVNKGLDDEQVRINTAICYQSIGKLSQQTGVRSGSKMRVLIFAACRTELGQHRERPNYN